ncbi:hypothetical protein [Methylobacterium aquaticum]|uniref:Uncharacterized protein n=1 Tax=Methylobacterium aquaticum TaxID=270351 RepID=A0A0C6FH24_9HYPH|nr:hypothetical protein [Methylobacterium aquaticum]BAQ44374.1 hypothetical protein Maq22A_c04840 [Methylobacterium aquaticum]
MAEPLAMPLDDVHAAWANYCAARSIAEESGAMADGMIAAGAWAAWFHLATGTEAHECVALDAAWEAFEAYANARAYALANRRPDDGRACGRAWAAFLHLFTPAAFQGGPVTRRGA